MKRHSWSLRLLFAVGHYEDAFVRFVGAFMIALATIVTQIIRHRLEVLYSTTLVVRSFFLAVIVGLYLSTGDRLFLMILGVVALGFVLTLTGFLAERGRARRAPPSPA